MEDGFTSVSLKMGGRRPTRTGDPSRSDERGILRPWNTSSMKRVVTINCYPKKLISLISFWLFFFWFVTHNSFAMIRIAQ
jgi:hypothetical protein